MEIIVNDTNIFIDLYSIGLLEALCELPYDVRTVDFVVAELTNPDQSDTLSALAAVGKIRIESFDAEEIGEIVSEYSSVPGNISLPDVQCVIMRENTLQLYSQVIGSFVDMQRQVMWQ